jgi:hypothetical protein
VWFGHCNCQPLSPIGVHRLYSVVDFRYRWSSLARRASDERIRGRLSVVLFDVDQLSLRGERRDTAAHYIGILGGRKQVLTLRLVCRGFGWSRHRAIGWSVTTALPPQRLYRPRRPSWRDQNRVAEEPESPGGRHGANDPNQGDQRSFPCITVCFQRALWVRKAALRCPRIVLTPDASAGRPRSRSPVTGFEYQTSLWKNAEQLANGRPNPPHTSDIPRT